VQATRGQVGKIQHKRIEKLPSKREREEMKMQKGAQIQKNIGPNGKFRNGMPTGMNGRPQAGNGTKGAKPAEPEKKVKKAALATTGYAGTARPKPGASSRPGASRPGPSSRPMQSSKRYTYASEEEDEEEVDEEEDYASDGSSDMEAAAFEVDEEEEFAARMARKEDAEALAEENRLKREKEAKKRRLMAMAAKRR